MKTWGLWIDNKKREKFKHASVSLPKFPTGEIERHGQNTQLLPLMFADSQISCSDGRYDEKVERESTLLHPSIRVRRTLVLINPYHQHQRD